MNHNGYKWFPSLRPDAAYMSVNNNIIISVNGLSPTMLINCQLDTKSGKFESKYTYFIEENAF